MAEANSSDKPIRFTATCRNLVGETFGRLTVRRLVGRHGKGSVLMWECDCTCGEVAVVATADLKKGQQSCGCLHREISAARLFKHGFAKTREYRIWGLMISRCHDPKNKSFVDYGGRGIAVCERWRESFENFYADMGARPTAQHTIDRKDNDKGYEPDNCHWATRTEQNSNTTRNHFLTHADETLTISEWAERLGFDTRVIHCRLRRGWSVEKTLTTPKLATWSRKTT